MNSNCVRLVDCSVLLHLRVLLFFNAAYSYVLKKEKKLTRDCTEERRIEQISKQIIFQLLTIATMHATQTVSQFVVHFLLIGFLLPIQGYLMFTYFSKNYIKSLIGQTTQAYNNYTCSTEELNFHFTFSISSHSAWQPSNSCSLSSCIFRSSNSSGNCLQSSTPCYDYRTAHNASYCAPGALCSLLEPCNSITGQCASNESVCVVNSCCIPQSVCLPLSWNNLCSSTYAESEFINA